MNDVTRDQPGGVPAAVPPPPAALPRPAASAPPQRNTLAMVLPVVCLVAVSVMWLRLDGQIAQLRDNQRRLAEDVSSLKQTAAIDVSDAPALGPDGAVVTLVEFSDYECPFCVRHFKQTMPQLEANFIRPGKIRYVFRDFPIDELHPEAIRVHETARCGLEQDQDKFLAVAPLLVRSAGHPHEGPARRPGPRGRSRCRGHSDLSRERSRDGRNPPQWRAGVSAWRERHTRVFRRSSGSGIESGARARSHQGRASIFRLRAGDSACAGAGQVETIRTKLRNYPTTSAHGSTSAFGT